MRYSKNIHTTKNCNMLSVNYDVSVIILEYCEQKVIKKVNVLSKKWHNIAKYELIYTFSKKNLKYINDTYHHKIHLTRTNIGDIPNIYYDRICILNLSCNQLTELPESIGQLVCLQVLSVIWNKLTVLPESIGS